MIKCILVLWEKEVLQTVLVCKHYWWNTRFITDVPRGDYIEEEHILKKKNDFAFGNDHNVYEFTN